MTVRNCVNDEERKELSCTNATEVSSKDTCQAGGTSCQDVHSELDGYSSEENTTCNGAGYLEERGCLIGNNRIQIRVTLALSSYARRS